MSDLLSKPFIRQTAYTVVFVWLGLVTCPNLPAAEPPPAIDFSNTYAVIVGVLKWEDKGLTPYAVEKRKDQELHDVLRERGVAAENIALLLDEKATLVNIKKALRDTIARTQPKSTFIFYYAGHGWRNSKGVTEFANYDYHARKPDKPAFATTEISEGLKGKFKGSQVLLFADCCYSGGLTDIAKNLTTLKFQAAAITSADALCSSTGNWTFTQTLVDGFRGLPTGDADGNGTIELGELAYEVAQAMKFREKQKHGYAAEGLPETYGLSTVDRKVKVPEPFKGAFNLKEYVGVRDGDHLQTGRVVGRRNEKYDVEFYGYNDKQVKQYAASSLSKLQFKTYKLNDTVTVVSGKLHKAKIVEVVGDFHRVTYPNRAHHPDEWVLSDQIVDDPKSVAEIKWKGDWYPAIVLKTEGEKYYVRYLGYDDSWNEWVTKTGIRFNVQQEEKSRNPFGVEDVRDPEGKEVKDFAAGVKLAGDKKDPNAESWVKRETDGKPGSLDGDWSGRWASGSGTARIKVLENRVFILYTDMDDRGVKGSTSLIEAVKDGKDRLIGRWVTVGNATETGPFVGLIVNDERIDGTWGDGARWDFRRKLKK